jgi:hypothetical protein
MPPPKPEQTNLHPVPAKIPDHTGCLGRIRPFRAGLGSLGYSGTIDAEEELTKSLGTSMRRRNRRSCSTSLLRCVDARRRKTLPASWLCCMRGVAVDSWPRMKMTQKAVLVLLASCLFLSCNIPGVIVTKSCHVIILHCKASMIKSTMMCIN